MTAKRVVFTGGTGKAGRHALPYLKDKGYDLLNVDLMPSEHPDIATLIADRDLLDTALRALDPEWRAVVVLHYYLGMPLPHVAATLGIPIGTAKSRLHRSLAAMRVTIGSDMGSELSPVTGGQYA